MTQFSPVLTPTSTRPSSGCSSCSGSSRSPPTLPSPRDCRACADWHVEDLKSIGFEASAHATPGHPIVVGHDRSAPGPSALFYGHYDVQPVDPLELWDQDPFEPIIETRPDGTRAIRARGASDDKGQLMTFVEACRAWKAVTGKLPIPVSILLEGEEESGGVNLPPFLKANADELRADIGLICDTNMWDPATPAIQTMLRGLCGEEIVIRAADRDLHSGFYGSAAANPNHVLARILADLRDADGRVTIPGFYDGVPELPAALRAQWEQLPFDPSAFLGAVGLSVPAGERGRTRARDDLVAADLRDQRHGRRLSGRGLQDGDPGRGLGQGLVPPGVRPGPARDPRGLPRVRPRARAGRLQGRVPRARRRAARSASRSRRRPSARPRDALTAEWGREAFFIGGGGSIPVTHELKNALGMDVVLAGFALDDDRIHSPNEKYELESFRRGVRSWARILDALGS